jgi:hypothetical protein
MKQQFTASDNRLVYRVYIQRDTNSVVITPLGMECLEFDLEGEYMWDQLPQWMTDKLAVLNTLYVPPPPNEVEGVGKRISPNVFWVYK